MTSRGSSCINLLDLNCQWLDISKSHILVYCLFGYLRYKCRSVVLDTAELSGMLYKSSGRWGSLVYHCVTSKGCFMIIVRYSLVGVEFVNILYGYFLKASIILGLSEFG